MRTDLVQLAYAHPDLARRLRECRQALDRTTTPERMPEHEDDTTGPVLAGLLTGISTTATSGP